MSQSPCGAFRRSTEKLSQGCVRSYVLMSVCRNIIIDKELRNVRTLECLMIAPRGRGFNMAGPRRESWSRVLADSVRVLWLGHRWRNGGGGGLSASARAD